MKNNCFINSAHYMTSPKSCSRWSTNVPVPTCVRLNVHAQHREHTANEARWNSFVVNDWKGERDDIMSLRHSGETKWDDVKDQKNNKHTLCNKERYSIVSAVVSISFSFNSVNTITYRVRKETQRSVWLKWCDPAWNRNVIPHATVMKSYVSTWEEEWWGEGRMNENEN